LREYRTEIDGLRALSILGVVFYHLKPDALTGGFLGVDVFFVISGYLISTNILKKIEVNQFSLTNFWGRRFRRLYPNLLLMVAVTVAAGNFILINPERKELFWQAISSIFAFSNIFLWKTTGGYWHTASENIALLHTWSLSLEEQFYFVLPLTLILFSRYINRRNLLLFVVILAIVSLALCILGTQVRRSAAFYLLPTRMWEFLFGVAIACFPATQENKLTTKSKGIISVGGLLLILISFLCVKNNQFFPGYLPVFVCIGTSAIILCSRDSHIVSNFLRLPPLVYIGRTSYSIYLWHWPVIVFQKYCTTTPSAMSAVILTAALALPAYHFVENPLRSNVKLAYIFSPLFALSIIVGLGCIHLNAKSPGLPQELSALEDNTAGTRGWEFEATDQILKQQDGIHVGSKFGNTRLILLGSSHARMLGAAVAEFSLQNKIKATLLTTTRVGLATKNIDDAPYAEKINAVRFDIVNNYKPDVLILAGRWSIELRDDNLETELPRILSNLSNAVGYLIIIGQVPEIKLPEQFNKSLQKYMLAATRSDKNFQLFPTPSSFQANSKIKQIVDKLNNPNIEFLGADDLFLQHDGSIKSMIKNKFLYSDYNHINNNGAMHVLENRLNEKLIKKINANSMQ
jgi:peptidoglycan/LPS O-acetylase OafA/YrhL